jgi:hypothetical protein
MAYAWRRAIFVEANQVVFTAGPQLNLARYCWYLPRNMTKCLSDAKLGSIVAGFVARPLENGAGKESATLESFPADVSARDFLELAEKLA